MVDTWHSVAKNNFLVCKIIHFHHPTWVFIMICGFFEEIYIWWSQSFHIIVNLMCRVRYQPSNDSQFNSMWGRIARNWNLKNLALRIELRLNAQLHKPQKKLQFLIFFINFLIVSHFKPITLQLSVFCHAHKVFLWH